MRAVIDGLVIAVKNGVSIAWDHALSLCLEIASQPRDLPEKEDQVWRRDPHWGRARRSALDLLAEGFESKGHTIQLTHRAQCWEIILIISDDPDPPADREAKDSLDAFSLSLNSVRGQATHCALKYASWAKKELAKAGSVAPVEIAFDKIPELAAFLDKCLVAGPVLPLYYAASLKLVIRPSTSGVLE
jgi:hypothetical protein